MDSPASGSHPLDLPAEPLETLPGATHRFVPTRRGRIHVAELGDGPRLVLVHGWPQDHRAWRYVALRLADRYRLVMPDLLGFGWSDAPAVDYTKEALADDLVECFDALGLDRFGLVGHDWGGWIGFLLALRIPSRITGFVVMNIAHPWTRASWDPRRILPLAYMPIVALPGVGPALLRHTGAVKGLIRGGVARGNRLPDADIEGFADRLREPARARASSALYRHFLLRELPSLGRTYRGRRLEVPVTVVFGTRDPAVHRSMVAGLDRKADVVEWIWVEDAGHFVVEERPEVVAAAIRGRFP